MKFVYFGYDHMLPAIQRLLEDGHELMGIFTFNCDNIFNFNTQTIALGQSLGIPTLLERPAQNHIDEFIAYGCDVFIAAGFPAKIPPPDADKAYAINLHPSLLPKGRGMMPTPNIIINAPEAAGLSVHKLTDKFDQGDILYQEALPLAPNETADTYAARIAARGPEVLSMLMANLPRYWAEASPQDHSRSSWFPVPDDAMRTLNWHDTIAQIDKTARAFGTFGALGDIDGTLHAIYEYDIQEKSHNHPPGQVIDQSLKHIKIAIADGFIDLKKFAALH